MKKNVEAKKGVVFKKKKRRIKKTTTVMIKLAE